MTISRINWASQKNRVTSVILITGVPVVLTAAGVRPTSVSVTSGTIDRLFWPRTGTLTETLPGAGGTFDPVKDLLDPRETFEVYEKIDLLKGEVKVDPFTFSLLDTGGQATALISRRDSMVSQQLASDITASATSIPLSNTASFPTGYIAAIGRETVTYDGITGTNLVNVTRGKYGSVARVHLSPVEHRGLVTAGGARHWQGRQASVWLCSLSEDGLTLSDPTLIFLGSVGAGVQLTSNLGKWSVPLDHITESLGRKLNIGTVNLYGWAHGNTSIPFHPLRITANGIPAITTDELGDPNNGGWHPTVASFVSAANAVTTTEVSSFLTVRMTADGKMAVVADGTTFDLRVHAGFCWDTATWSNEFASGESKTLYSVNPAPTDLYHLDNYVYIPTASDFAKIPTTFEWGGLTPGGVTGTATLAITADTDNTEGLTASITLRDAAKKRVRVEASIPSRAVLHGAQIAAASRCTKKVTANLGIIARGPTPIAALMAASKAIAAMSGEDLYSTSVDWTRLERAFARAPNRVTEEREYRFANGDDTFLSVLADECRLHGLCLTITHGLLSAIRVGSVAQTEPTSASIGESNLLSDGEGKEIPFDVIDSTQPLATSMEFSIPGSDPGEPNKLTITDTTYQEEFGDGETIECKALLSLPMGTDWTGVRTVLFDLAQQVLGSLSEPCREIRLGLPPPFLGLQPGDLIEFTSTRVPNWEGTRGVTAVCLVQDVRRSLFGGQMRGTIGIRLQSGDPVGYAPEALVAAGGLSAISPVVALDITSGWGAACFALPYGASGASTSNPSLGFAVGDKVRLSQFARAPIANESFTIVSIDTVANTVTLDGNPTAGMVAAAVAYGVSLRFDAYGAAGTTQRSLWGWESSPTTQLLNGTDNTKRWA